MKYSQFEALVLTIASTVIVGATIAMSVRGGVVIEEVVAQVMLLVVLFFAVHWGRNGGFLSAIVALLFYVFLRVPLALQTGLTSDIVTLIVVRMITYGVAGIIVGELCARVKYFFAGFEGAVNIDQATRLYNQSFVSQLLTSSIAKHTRYGAPFSLVLIDFASTLFSDLRPQKQRVMMRSIANHLRNDVRVVDDVGRLDDGRFVLLLPHTAKDGARIVSDRVRKGLCDLLGARDESISAAIMAAPDDLGAMEQLRRELEPASDTEAAAVSYEEAGAASAS